MSTFLEIGIYKQSKMLTVDHGYHPWLPLDSVAELLNILPRPYLILNINKTLLGMVPGISRFLKLLRWYQYAY